MKDVSKYNYSKEKKCSCGKKIINRATHCNFCKPRNTTIIVCEQCGEKQKRPKCVKKDRKRNFCSRKCYWNWLKGRFIPNKSHFKTGEEHFCWNGGSSFKPYGIEFNDSLRESVRNRDKRTCQICGCSEIENSRQLSVHHIDYNKKNNIMENLISLCTPCHSKTNHKRKHWQKKLGDKLCV